MKSIAKRKFHPQVSCSLFQSKGFELLHKNQSFLSSIVQQENRLRNHRSFRSRPNSHKRTHWASSHWHYLITLGSVDYNYNSFSSFHTVADGKKRSPVTIRSLLSKHFVLYQLLLFFSGISAVFADDKQAKFFFSSASGKQISASKWKIADVRIAFVYRKRFSRKSSKFLDVLFAFRSHRRLSFSQLWSKYYHYSSELSNDVMDGRKTIVTSRRPVR